MIALENVSLVFGEGTLDRIQALDSVNLKLDKGDFLTIIGSNGAGKSSLFNVISGHYFPASGTILRNGLNISRLPEYKRARFIGRIFQDPLMGTAGNMSVENNLVIAGSKGMKKLKITLNKRKKAEYREKLAQLDMGLENRMQDNVGLLSGGQRQALTMLMMALSSPELVLLDEHTAALDPRNAARVLELTNRFHKEYGFTVMMITHDMQRAITHGNHLIMMDKGEIIYSTKGSEKQHLTVEDLVHFFHNLRGEDLTNDEALLI